MFDEQVSTYFWSCSVSLISPCFDVIWEQSLLLCKRAARRLGTRWRYFRLTSLFFPSLPVSCSFSIFFLNIYRFSSIMAEDSESAASQQSLELDDQDTCGIDGDNEEENEHMQG